MDNKNVSDLMNLAIHWMDTSEYIFQVEIEKDATIIDLKLKIEEMIKCPAKTQTLWCHTSMGELEDDLSIWSSDRISSDIMLQTDTDQTTFKVRNALHQHPLTVTLYNVDRISDLKDSVCNTMLWWKDTVNSSKEIDVDAVLYSVSPRRKCSDDLKIGDIDNRGLYHTRMDCVFVFKVKTAPAAIGTVEVFKVCMFDEGLMEIYVEAKANSSTIHDLKGEIEKVMVMIDLSGCEKRVTQNGNVLSDDTMLNTLESHTVYATLV